VKSTPKTKSKSRARGHLPTKPLLDELERLRGISRAIVARYVDDIENDISKIADAVSDQSTGKNLPQDRVADLRDMLMLLRGLEVKPAKGRRRDLKKVENTLEELASISERW